MRAESLSRLLRYERGELSSRAAKKVRHELASDPDARSWLAWIEGLREASAGGALDGDAVDRGALDGGGATEPDPIDVAALAEGTLAPDRAREVRTALARCAGGYGMLEVALGELAFHAPPAAAADEKRQASRSWRAWGPWTLVAATLLAVIVLWRTSGGGGGSGDGPSAAAVAALTERTAMPVPTMRSTALMKGLALYQDADYPRAAEVLSETVTEEPDNGPAWLYLGSAHLLLGRDAEAASALRRAVETCRDSFAVEASWQLAQALLATGEGEAARQRLVELRDTARAEDARGQIRELDALSADHLP